MIPFFQNDEICYRACDASNMEFYCNRSTISRKRTNNQFWIWTRLLIIAENYRICELNCDWQYGLNATNHPINIDLGSPIADPLQIICPKKCVRSAHKIWEKHMLQNNEVWSYRSLKISKMRAMRDFGDLLQNSHGYCKRKGIIITWVAFTKIIQHTWSLWITEIHAPPAMQCMGQAIQNNLINIGSNNTFCSPYGRT